MGAASQYLTRAALVVSDVTADDENASRDTTRFPDQKTNKQRRIHPLYHTMTRYQYLTDIIHTPLLLPFYIFTF